ncbi:MAG: LacI family DNA-binding transcriptional regulator [Tyzzerella sp.]|nr:LacI family DNA-binding transcriptional regulator [Tyzzerella sp.]
MISTSELAKLAGVSQSTISRCLNDHPSISFETKERVQKLALQYGYVEQKRGKKTFFTGEHKVIGILVEDRPFFDDLFINYTIGKLISKASKKNYYTIRLPISSQEVGSMERLKEFLRLNLIDGFIIMHRRFDEEIHEYLNELGIPHVYLLHCSRNSFEAVDMIDTDNYAGGYLGTKHLIEHGHKNIITLTCPWREFEDRTNGYLHALEEAGIEVNRRFVLMGECSYQSAYEITSKNLDLFRSATAIYVQSDIMTTGVVNALQHHGIRIPEDISIVGTDGYELGTFSNPQFDSVAHPISELTDLAVSRLIEKLGRTKPQSPRQIILRPYIVERSSVKSV